MSFYAFIVSSFVVAVTFAGGIRYTKGAAGRNAEIAEYQAAIKVSEIAAREATVRAEKAAARVVVEYRDRVKVIREVQPAEIQLVEVIKSEASCLAPPAFRVLHDSAASGDPAPKDSTGVDAAPVPLEEAASTVAENYRIARENAARLESLQTLIRSLLGMEIDWMFVVGAVFGPFFMLAVMTVVSVALDRVLLFYYLRSIGNDHSKN